MAELFDAVISRMDAKIGNDQNSSLGRLWSATGRLADEHPFLRTKKCKNITVGVCTSVCLTIVGVIIYEIIQASNGDGDDTAAAAAPTGGRTDKKTPASVLTETRPTPPPVTMVADCKKQAETISCHGMENVPQFERDDAILHAVFTNNTWQNLTAQAFGNLSNLITLDLSNSLIQKWQPNVFEGLDQLEELTLAWNSISSLVNEAFWSLSNLRCLDLSHNYLKSVWPNAFLGLGSLTRLNLASNAIKQLENGVFKHMPNLERIFVNNNQIEDVATDVFNDTPSLKYLELSDNKMAYLPENLFKKTNLLTNINLSNNMITKIWGNTFKNVKFRNGVGVLDLSSNNIAQVDANAFQQSAKLEKLDITRNPLECQSLSSLPDGATYDSECISVGFEYPTTLASDTVCFSSPCGQNGICKADMRGYTCDCIRGYGGAQCTEKLGERSKLSKILATVSFSIAGGLLTWVCMAMIRKQRHLTEVRRKATKPKSRRLSCGSGNDAAAPKKGRSPSPGKKGRKKKKQKNRH